MLSIVKMDFDSAVAGLERQLHLFSSCRCVLPDTDILDENLIKSEEIDIVDEPIGNNHDLIIRNSVAHSLELVPVVYTTRLDDMTVLKLDPAQICPKQATCRIIKESKPVLRTNPGVSKKTQHNEKRFDQVKTILQELYRSPKKINITEEIDIKPDVSNIIINVNSMKSEVLDEPSCKETKTKNTCKYSELLKLCKPCSVVLPVLIGYPFDQVIHGGQVLQANRVSKSSIRRLTSELPLPAKQSLVTPRPNLLTKLNVDNTEKIGVTRTNKVIIKIPEINCDRIHKPPKLVEVNTKGKTEKKTTTNFPEHIICQRLLRNGLLELHDTFSKDYHMYFTDNESNTYEYFKDTTDNAVLYEKMHRGVDCKYKLENCCWVKKEESIQSLYPKVLIYPSSRFMRRPHPCKPGACVCCCRKKENIMKSNLVFTNDRLISDSEKQVALNKEDIEIQDLEDEIHKTIISINRTTKTEKCNELLRKLLTDNRSKLHQVPNGLIEKALIYKKPMPKKQAENRHLMTLKKGDTQNTVIILRNYAIDVIEIYTVNADGDIETYTKTTCYNNTSQPGVRKLLKTRNAMNRTVCCWFKREEIITKLLNSKALNTTAAKFLRINHNCQSKECTCCCKPEIKSEKTLTDIKLPPRRNWTGFLKSFKLTNEEESVPVASQSTVRPSPLAPSTSSETSTYQNSDDCQITSVITSPTLHPLSENPVLTIPMGAAPSPSLLMTDVVNNDELSQEVNSLITSILDRFKDVRLTINSDGKVAASLNTPVNTLTTVELKVLANILSYAQSQVNLLGLKVNSGMSLSNIINLKTEDIQSNSTLDPNSIFKEFGKNVTVNTNAQGGSFNNVILAPQAPELQSIPETYNYFTNSMSVRNQHFNDAFSSFISSNMETNPPAEQFTPVIQDVFSLKEQTGTDSASTTVWYRKPLLSPSEEPIKTDSNNSKKRNDNMETETSNPKKIRVRSPSKLGVATNEFGNIAITAPRAAQQTVKQILPKPIILNHTLDVPQPQTTVNGTPVGLLSQPMLIINPLNTINSIGTGGTVTVPFTESTLNTQNVGNISVSQPKIPVILNYASTSQFLNVGNQNLSTEGDTTPTEGAKAPAIFSEVECGADNDSDLEMLEYSEDNEVKTEYSIEIEPEKDCEYNEPEDEDCGDNEPEEEDCILGF